MFYFEVYYFESGGGYYDHLYGIFPYGAFIPPNDKTLNKIEHCDEEFGQMGGEYPNTIGIIDEDYSYKVYSMLLDRDRFDYNSMNNYVVQMDDFYKDDYNNNSDYENTDLEDINDTIEYNVDNDFEEDLDEYIEKEYYKEDLEEEENVEEDLEEIEVFSESDDPYLYYK